MALILGTQTGTLITSLSESDREEGDGFIHSFAVCNLPICGSRQTLVKSLVAHWLYSCDCGKRNSSRECRALAFTLPHLRTCKWEIHTVSTTLLTLKRKLCKSLKSQKIVTKGHQTFQEPNASFTLLFLSDQESTKFKLHWCQTRSPGSIESGHVLPSVVFSCWVGNR